MLNLYFVSRVMHVTVKTPLAGQSDTISYVTHITDLRELLSRILWKSENIDPKCHRLIN